MTNPFSGYGISDRDYAATVAALSGEMSPKAKQDDVDRILDSIVNRADQNSTRLADGTVQRGSLGSVVTAPGQYDAMRGIGNHGRGNARTNGGQRAAREAFIGALAPSKLSPEARTRVEMANKAIENVVVTGVSRGIAQGATDYRNAELTDRWGTGGMHRANENVYGSLEDTTGHRFSGTGFNPDMEFDPVSLHGQLQDIGLPAELSGLTAPEVSLPAPDLPGALGGFGNIDGLNVSVPSAPDVMSQMPGPDYSDLTASLYGNYNAPSLPSTPDPMQTMDGPTYPGMSADLYGGAPASNISVPSPPDVGGLSLDNYGPTIGEMDRSTGFHAGADLSPYGSTPDFNAPSLNEREQFSRVSDPITSYSFDSVTHGLNDALMNELSPQTQREATYRDVPVFSAPNAMQDAYLGAIDDQHPRAPVTASAPVQVGTKREFTGYREVPVQPVAPKALPSEVIGAPPSLSSSFASAPASLGDVFGTGQHGFNDFMAGIGAKDKAAMDAVNNAGMGYAASYAMGDGPYATMGTNDLQDRFGKDFGMNARAGLAEGFQHDYGQLSPTARGGLEGGLKGLATGGPLGMLGGGILGALGGYALPNGLSGLFDGTFGSGLERGTPGNMSNFGSPYDDAGLAGPYDSLFGGAPGAAGNMHDMQAIQDAYDARNGGGLGGLFGGGSFGGDPSQDGGARYAG